MKVFTGKQLFDAFSGLSEGMGSLDHLSKGELPCKKCNGTGWVRPSPRSLLISWLKAFPFRLRFGKKSTTPEQAEGNEDADRARVPGAHETQKGTHES